MSQDAPRLLLISQWPKVRNAEYELIEKIRETGFDIAVVDFLGRDVATGSNLNDATLRDRYDFALSFHYATPKFLDLPTFLWVANPLGYMHLRPDYRAAILDNLRAYDDYLYNGAPLLKQHVRRVVGDEWRDSGLHFYAQLQVGDFSIGQKTQAGKPLTERRVPGVALRLWGTQSDGTPQSYQLGSGLSFSGGYLTATGGGGGGSLPSYTGQAGKVLRVAVGEAGVEWVSSLSTIADGSITGSKLATAYAPLASPTFTGTVTIPSGADISGYLTVNGSAAQLTNFPTLNQSTTGNAATATILQTAEAQRRQRLPSDI